MKTPPVGNAPELKCSLCGSVISNTPAAAQFHSRRCAKIRTLVRDAKKATTL